MTVKTKIATINKSRKRWMDLLNGRGCIRLPASVTGAFFKTVINKSGTFPLIITDFEKVSNLF